MKLKAQQKIKKRIVVRVVELSMGFCYMIGMDQTWVAMNFHFLEMFFRNRKMNQKIDFHLMTKHPNNSFHTSLSPIPKSSASLSVMQNIHRFCNIRRLPHLSTHQSPHASIQPFRNYFTIPSVRFSPSHTRSHKFVWKVAPNDEISCYDLMYECTAFNVTIFDGEDDPGCRMQVECCEDGILSHIIKSEPISIDRSPDETIAILATSQIEREIITDLLNEETGDAEQVLAKLRQCEALEEEGVIPWEAYLATK